MREIIIGDETCQIRGSLWTLLIYRDEFSRSDKKADLMADVFGVIADAAKAGVDLDNLENIDISRIDMARFMGVLFPVLQVTWAMCKTAHAGGDFPGFVQWVKAHEEADLMGFLQPVMEEAQRAFFRDAATVAKAKKTA